MTSRPIITPIAERVRTHTMYSVIHRIAEFNPAERIRCVDCEANVPETIFRGRALCLPCYHARKYFRR